MLKIIQISLIALITLGFITMMGFVLKTNMSSDINDININIYHNGEKGFLTKEIALTEINNIDSITSLKIKDVDIKEIEKTLNSNPFVRKSDCFLTIHGDVLINIQEKTPVIRVYNKTGKSTYIDQDGDFIPISQNYTPRVIIASGYIDENTPHFNQNVFDSTYNNSYFRKVFKLAMLINNSKLLSAQISQIYVNSKGELDLVPELGEHIIKFGNFEEAETKLEKLEAYYKKNMTLKNWDKYHTISLIYKDQIVCTKK